VDQGWVRTGADAPPLASSIMRSNTSSGDGAGRSRTTTLAVAKSPFAGARIRASLLPTGDLKCGAHSRRRFSS
jgi:hypothetical protein